MQAMRLAARAGALLSLLMVATPAMAAFEDIEVCPRARALGGAWTAASADAFAPFHNPSALAWTRGLDAAASTVRPYGYDFASQETGSVAIGLPRALGGMALGVRRFGVDYGGETLLRETTVSIAHGVSVLSDFQSEMALGWSLNVYALDFGTSVTGLDPGSASTVGLNVGGTAVVREQTRVGFHVLNLNGPSIGSRDHEDLRRALSVGVVHSPYPGVATALDIASEAGRSVQYRGGAEFQAAGGLWLRAGIHSEPSVFTAGLGFDVRGVRIDYGFSTGGVLAETHQFGIGFRRRPAP
jgi:hypothetical protein